MKKLCVKAVNVFVLILVLLTFSKVNTVVYASTLNSDNNSIVKLRIEQKNGRLVYA